ncbi:hypothetical protein CK203_086523 [Vitis vinifera]|uniref:Uncharacterized protein n=1 Tax=Vitis vinifera TaxID=29760 RepID=A0A438EIP5_VITVI|nr:hypothetical protein CK203_086523 [Vitis vinifera]
MNLPKLQHYLVLNLFVNSKSIPFFATLFLYLKDASVFQVIGAMGGFAYIMDKDGAFRNSFSDGWDRILSRHPIPFYYCIGKLSETFFLTIY